MATTIMSEVHVVCDPRALQLSRSLKTHRDEIAKAINPLELSIYLTDRGFLDEGEADEVTDLPHEECAERILSEVRKRGDEGLKDFLWCLEQDNDWHIGHGYAAALLRGDTFTDETRKAIEESLRLRARFRKQLDVMRIIRNSVNVNDLIPSLRKHRLLTDDETEDLQLPHRTRGEQVHRMLQIFSTKGPLAELYFTNALADATRHNPAHRDILERIYCQSFDSVLIWCEQVDDVDEKDGCSSQRSLLGKRRKASLLDRPYATKAHIRTPRQVRAHGIILSDKYFDIINEIRRLHYHSRWDKAEKVVENCRRLIETTEPKKLGLPTDDELDSTANKEVYVAVALRNCSGYVTRKMPTKILGVVSEAKELCKRIENDNGRVLESKCEWMLAKMYRYAKQFDKAIEHIENAQLLHIKYNIAPGEDTTLCNYCKGCILSAQLAESGDYTSKSKKFEEAKLCFRKATEHAAIRDYAIYQSHHMIRLAQLCLHSSQFVAGECKDEEQIEEARAALNSHYIDENVLAPRTKCLFYVTRSDLHRNMNELHLAEEDAQRALDIAVENKFSTEIKSAEGRLDKINECRREDMSGQPSSV